VDADDTIKEDVCIPPTRPTWGIASPRQLNYMYGEKKFALTENAGRDILHAIPLDTVTGTLLILHLAFHAQSSFLLVRFHS
jgi:hypothetical protein